MLNVGVVVKEAGKVQAEAAFDLDGVCDLNVRPCIHRYKGATIITPS